MFRWSKVPKLILTKSKQSLNPGEYVVFTYSPGFKLRLISKQPQSTSYIFRGLFICFASVYQQAGVKCLVWCFTSRAPALIQVCTELSATFKHRI